MPARPHSLSYESRERIERYWERVLGVGSDDAPARVIEHRDHLRSYPGVIGVQRRCRLTMSAPASVLDQVRALGPAEATSRHPHAANRTSKASMGPLEPRFGRVRSDLQHRHPAQGRIGATAALRIPIG